MRRMRMRTPPHAASMQPHAGSPCTAPCGPHAPPCGPMRTLASEWLIAAPFLAKRQPRPFSFISSSQAASTLPLRMTAALMQ